MEDASKIVSEWQTLEGVKQATLSATLLLEFGSGLKAENPANIPGVGTGTFPGQTHAENPVGWWYMDSDVMMAFMGQSNEGAAPVLEFTLKTDSETLYRAVLKGKEKHDRRWHVVAEF